MIARLLIAMFAFIVTIAGSLFLLHYTIRTSDRVNENNGTAAGSVTTAAGLMLLGLIKVAAMALAIGAVAMCWEVAKRLYFAVIGL